MSTIQKSELAEALLELSSLSREQLENLRKNVSEAAKQSPKAPETTRLSWVTENLPRERQLELEIAYDSYVKKMVREGVRPLDPEGWLETKNIGPAPKVLTADERLELRAKFAEATQFVQADKEPAAPVVPVAPSAEDSVRAAFTELMVAEGHGSVMERASFLARKA